MQIFINERPVEAVGDGVATVGELVDALAVYVDPGEVVTRVTIDGASFSAGDEARYARRAAAGVGRLALTTRTRPELAAELRAAVYEALRHIRAKVHLASEGLVRGARADAQRAIGAAVEELRLALILDGQAAALGAGPGIGQVDELIGLAEALLAALERRDAERMRALLADRLLPLLDRWGARNGGPGTPGVGRDTAGTLTDRQHLDRGAL